MSQKPKLISITTGDVDGIGMEVSAKALLSMGPKVGFNFVLSRSDKKSSSLLAKKLDRKFERLSFKNFSHLVAFLKNTSSFSKQVLFEVVHRSEPPFWVEESAELCMNKTFAGLCTAPMSKDLIMKSGLQDMGHTDILSRVSGTKDVRMGFAGDHFNVVIATGHVPVQRVSIALTEERLRVTLSLARDFSQALGLKKKPMALLGLNPHAGENGLIGSEELQRHKAVLRWATASGLAVQGPLVPDAAFLPSNWKKYSCYVACYHDQGLIPFKMVHGQETGCHVTLGLPFVRTSVDHGTAKDIFGKNKAHPGSMLSALALNMNLLK